MPPWVRCPESRRDRFSRRSTRSSSSCTSSVRPCGARGSDGVRRGGTDYFLGSRSLPWVAVMLSVVATETSTLTFLSVPGVSYVGSLVFLQLTLGYLAGRIAVSAIFLPAPTTAANCLPHTLCSRTVSVWVPVG